MERRKRQVARMNIEKLEKSSIQDKVGLVIRTHIGRHSSPDIKEQLRKLGLHKKYDAVFIKLDSPQIGKCVLAGLSMCNMSLCIGLLKPLDSYVTYGYISSNSVNELIRRRAHTNIAGRKKILSDNVTIENVLGEKGILCVSDLVHEIYNVGGNFDEVLKILVPFKLSSPVGGFEKKILNIHDEIEKLGGFVGDRIDSFLTKIL